MATRRLRVRVKRYRASTRAYGPVELGVLEPLEGREVEVTARDPLDAMLRVAEEEARGARGDYVEVIVDDGEARRILGVAPRYTWSRALYYRPERLLRVGIARGPPGIQEPRSPGGDGEAGSEAPEEAGSVGAVELGEGDIEWHRVDEELYVFEGKAQLLSDDEDVALVIIETPSGSRIVRPAPASLRRRRAS
ncbi:MAG: hypothetical protein GSR80_000794 [Desulfurococcales archaeon]|nr:hypothetical protein [Desulfurococcales archaeon]